MPKPLKLRDTANPLGKKFHQVMDEKQMTADYGALARAFSVATPSVYDWIDHGRISKERYRQLVEWSGKPLDWWFDIPMTSIPSSDPMVIHQDAAVYDIKNGSKWPFSRTFEAFKRLSTSDQARVDGYITSLIDAANEASSTADPSTMERQGP